MGSTRKRTGMGTEYADRVRDALKDLLETRFGGDRVALAREIQMTRQGLGLLLDGTSTPTFETAVHVADALGVTPEGLLGGYARPYAGPRLPAARAKPLARVLKRVGDICDPDAVRVLLKGSSRRELTEGEWLVALVSLQTVRSLVDW